MVRGETLSLCLQQDPSRSSLHVCSFAQGLNMGRYVRCLTGIQVLPLASFVAPGKPLGLGES